LSALAQSIGGEFDGTSAYVLYGMQKVDLGGGNFSFSKGAVYDSATDEIYLFDVESSIAIATAPILTITESFPAAYNPVEFSDTNDYSPHQEKKLVVSDGTLGSADINYEDLFFVHDKWHVVGDTDEPAFENSWVNEGIAGFDLAFKRVGAFVEVRGNVKSGATGTVAFTLPVGYRPQEFTAQALTSVAFGGDRSALRILSSGGVFIDFEGSPSSILLGGTRFPID
jgi:hypothetical protein